MFGKRTTPKRRTIWAYYGALVYTDISKQLLSRGENFGDNVVVLIGSFSPCTIALPSMALCRRGIEYLY